MKSNKRPFWLLLLILALVVAACGGNTESPNTAGDAADAVEPANTADNTADAPADEAMDEAERKVATFIFTQEFDTLNPIYSGMWFVSITFELWNAGAWAFDENNEPFPVLITEMQSLLPLLTKTY